jgi:glucose 1-dehydrogenase
MSLNGKVAIVTGGNSGIGRAIALGLAKAGANIAIDYVAHPEATDALESEISRLGAVAIGVEADVSRIRRWRHHAGQRRAVGRRCSPG